MAEVILKFLFLLTAGFFFSLALLLNILPVDGIGGGNEKGEIIVVTPVNHFFLKSAPMFPGIPG